MTRDLLISRYTIQTRLAGPTRGKYAIVRHISASYDSSEETERPS